MSVLAPQDTERQVVIVGGGPAGLTAAHELAFKHDLRPIVLEKLDKVGGIARTENYKGYYFDMGGHRFFTKAEDVNEFWHRVLQDDFLLRPRLSRIYYDHKYFDYPLKPLNALANLGIWRSTVTMLSYLKWQIFPYREEETFEQWVTNRFGKELFETFFKSYTEKVWGISTSELKAEWAAQRIKNLDLKTAIVNMFVGTGTRVTSLIEQFHYPRRGPGMLWTVVKDQIEARGGNVHLNSNVVGFRREGQRIVSVKVTCNGHVEEIPGTDFISSMPIPDFIRSLDPPAPPHILEAANKLKFRDFLTVCLIIDKPDLFPDNWIYIHFPEVLVGRIQNFKNWSPDMVPDQSRTSLGLEYFCNQGDELWSMADEDLIELGSRELEVVGLARYEDVVDGAVFRVENTYPVYDSGYQEVLGVLREYLDGFENFQTIGRNGLHRYNNQDHAMLTGMLAVRNMVLGEENDLWVVNAEQEYHEEIKQADVDVERVEHAVEEAFAQAFLKMDAGAFGIAVGLAFGLVLFLATNWLVIRGGGVVGPNLALLNQFFLGYQVSFGGSFIGFAYGFLSGFLLGWWYAFLRNTVVLINLALIHRRAEVQLMRRLLDF
ncbi:MAG: NAD(P)/FAD-dependent oxidoreductase [Anaerolineales bacterium]|nr:NAD(P)/FAD-dependent oxidoreductase [Anaerolineales bacterium]